MKKSWILFSFIPFMALCQNAATASEVGSAEGESDLSYAESDEAFIYETVQNKIRKQYRPSFEKIPQSNSYLFGSSKKLQADKQKKSEKQPPTHLPESTQKEQRINRRRPPTAVKDGIKIIPQAPDKKVTKASSKKERQKNGLIFKN